MAYDYAETPAATVTDRAGNVKQGIPIQVYTGKGGTQLKNLKALDGTPLGAAVPTDVDGRFPFHIDSEDYPVVWAKDPEGDWYEIPATGLLGLIPGFANTVKGYPINAASLGCVAGDPDPAIAAKNAQLINDALQRGNVFIPAGTWWVDDALRPPDDTYLLGAGMDITWLKMIDGVLSNTPVVTNELNTNSAHTTPNRNIYVGHLSIDANRKKRNSDPQVNENGCAITFRCVEDAVIERVHALNGTHSFDISSSVYMDNSLPITDPQKMPPGPSKRVTVRECWGGGSDDDPFTTHCSGPVRFENCVAWNHEPTTRSGQCNGFEFDDGSYDITAIDCYSRGFNSGYQCKGHDPNIPSRRIQMIGCIADFCNYGFDLRWDGYEGQPELATSVSIISCGATNLGDANGYDEGLGYAYHPGLLIRAYSNVHVQDFRMWDAPYSQIAVRGGARNVTLEHIDIENCWTDPYNPGARGIITVYDGAGNDIKIRDVVIRKVKGLITGVLLSTANSCLVEDVRVEAGSAPPAWKASTGYAAGDMVQLSTGEILYANRAGTSGATEPTVQPIGTAFDDGTVRWEHISGVAVQMQTSTDRILARRITQTGYPNTALVRSGSNSGTYADQPPLPTGWWA